MTLANDRQGRVNIGGTVVYLHTLKNTGTVVEECSRPDHV
jgi:hypothetical protein